MGGGTLSPSACWPKANGLSPRGRGNQGIKPSAIFPGRSIPAWAGEPQSSDAGQRVDRVYPRVGGGTLAGRGYTRPAAGLSPRGRGNLLRWEYHNAATGSIPAWAGEPSAGLYPPDSCRVYPRVGGGTKSETLYSVAGSGLSPRGRGNRRATIQHKKGKGSIPAWAGEPEYPACGFLAAAVYPRVGGGTAGLQSNIRREKGLSPRGRGNPFIPQWPGLVGGSIPAWAGEPRPERTGYAVQRVYPRVGGGTQIADIAVGPSPGLSPRGRGNRIMTAGWIPARWSIPAWAGETRRRYPAHCLARVYPRVGGGNQAYGHNCAATGGLSPRGRGKPAGLA